MKRAILALSLVATPAVAAPVAGADAGRLDITGEAHGACVISAPAAQSGPNMAFQSADGASASIRVVDLVDPMTAQARGASINLAFPVICNGAHRVTVRAANGAMQRGGPAALAAPGFRDRLPYEVRATWAGRTASGPSESLTPVDISMGNGAAGLLSVAIAIAPGGAPLIAGAYSDALVVELQAAN